MLPVMIYEPDGALRMQLLDGLGRQDGAGLPRTQVALTTSSLADMRRAADRQSGIMLVILGVPKGDAAALTELGGAVMRQNRLNYTVFCLHDAADMDALLETCMRPAGILTLPLRTARLDDVLRRILEDYAQLTADTESDDYILIETGGTTYRVDHARILYIEALDKYLVIHTGRQNITVRRSLAAMEKTLPEQFIRCHRSVIINRQYVERIQLNEMTLTMTNGDLLPISRGQRAAIRGLIDEKGG